MNSWCKIDGEWYIFSKTQHADGEAVEVTTKDGKKSLKVVTSAFKHRDGFAHFIVDEKATQMKKPRYQEKTPEEDLYGVSDYDDNEEY